MRRSVERVFADSRDSDLADSLRANVSRFAAYKADYVKTTIENILNDASIPAKDKQAYIDANMNAFSQYQATEETTTTSRSRTAKQWKEFNDPQRLRLFPNLRWLPSRSIEKRQSHIQFYDHVWSKGDDFWNHNTPGTEWNCKCDVEETDDPVTNNGNMDPVQVPAGLEGNPAITREIFTDGASYIKKGNKQRVEKFWKPIEEGFETYRQYRDGSDYEDVMMSWDNGGMKATHINHKTHPNDNKKYFNDTLTGDDLEKEFMQVAFEKGHHIIFRKEDVNLTDLDMFLDGIKMDLKSVTENSVNLRNQLKSKNNQLINYNDLRSENNDAVCLYFHDASYFSYDKLAQGMQKLKDVTPKVLIKRVFVLKNDGSDVELYEFP